MKYYIDAYDWVMVGNVYGMSGFSDGGSITTKPYIASSNYLLKMSDYDKNEIGAIFWMQFYWRFLYIHSHKFDKNPRMKMQIALLNKMNKEKLDRHLKNRKWFYKKYFFITDWHIFKGKVLILLKITLSKRYLWKNGNPIK